MLRQKPGRGAVHQYAMHYKLRARINIQCMASFSGCAESIYDILYSALMYSPLFISQYQFMLWKVLDAPVDSPQCCLFSIFM